MFKVKIIDHYMNIDPDGIEVEDIKRIENMLTCMLEEPIIESYLQNNVFKDEDDAFESFQKFLDIQFPHEDFNACEFIIDCCKKLEFDLITKDEFLDLTDTEAVQYLNEVSYFLNMGDIVKIKDGKIYDLDSDTEIENLFDYALTTLHREFVTYEGSLNNARSKARSFK